MSVPKLTLPLEICHLKLGLTFRLADLWMGISLQFDKFNPKSKKKCIFIYENWLIVAFIYHSSQVRNRRGVLISAV